MRHRQVSGLLTVLVIASSVLTAPNQPATAYAGAPRFAPGRVYDQNFPDPSILEVDGVYHAYSTSTGGAGLPHMVSTDLVTWTAVGDALGQGPVWSPHPGFASEIWAPSVLELDDGPSATRPQAPRSVNQTRTAHSIHIWFGTTPEPYGSSGRTRGYPPTGRT